MAAIARTQRRLVASSIALLLMAAVMIPATTDARGGGGGFGGHGGGHGGGAHVWLPGTVRIIGPSSGPATVWRSVASSQRVFSRRNASFHRSSRIGSHFFTLGADGIWIDRFVYTPTIRVAQQSVPMQQQPVHRRSPVVKTPGAPRSGIIVVRGDTKSYVTFPSAERG
jgi:hypothetical protein